MRFPLLIVCLFLPTLVFAQPANSYVRDNYTKYEYKIPMRDGTKLHTAVYVPKDASATAKYPFMMQRTCYSVAPYGPDNYAPQLGPSQTLQKDKYIFVYQDVRGRWMSEGTWTNMTPNVPDAPPVATIISKKKGKVLPMVPRATYGPDESSDTFDTIEWLLKNIPNNNGRVGQWGISYPGFYSTASLPDAHPALKAVSPQAPIADFFFDDFHHNGAFIQAYLFTFPVFGVQHPAPTPDAWYNNDFIKAATRDGYAFQLGIGPLKNVAAKYYPNNFYWKETVEHPNYDEFWQKRNILPYLKNVKPAVMTVGGWFDAEDLYGPLNTYKTIEKNNPNTYNTLVMGPFGHGRWSRETGHTLHSNIYFGDSVATFYQRNIEAKFFNHFLKGGGDGKTSEASSGLPEAYLFDTGRKEWKTFDKWPAANAQTMAFTLMPSGNLLTINPNENISAGVAGKDYSEFISDPNKPVPYTEDNTTTMGFTPFNYMSEDQRFASLRPDVLTFQTDVFTEDMTLGGEITARLKVSTTGTDADWVVKLIDVYPGDEPNHPYMPNKNIILSNYQQMVRSEAMRGRFRNSFEKPEPFKPGEITDVTFRLQDVLHTFKKGHRVMIQVQSTWFPLIDRNPQTFVPNIFQADEKDFQKATHRIYSNSVIAVQVLK